MRTGNREFIGNQRRCQVVPPARQYTEDLLIGAPDVVAVNRGPSVVKRNLRAIYGRNGPRVGGVNPGFAEIVEIGIETFSIDDPTPTLTLIDPPLRARKRP